ncbi:hypothetical protein SEA_RIKSENGUPTA_7 [Microbacterium phage RikSengupta]|nr:hypothetical protein SEA_RIKSENGUPTA_7 [Microbacterium phage RikSengupta]
MLGLDPEGTITLDILCVLGDPGVEHIQAQWDNHGIATPISGDKHFKPKQYRVKAIRPATPEEIEAYNRKRATS